MPEDWYELSKAFSKSMLDYFKASRVDCVVCADQTFIKFLLAEEKLLVPEGLKRVGTTTVESDKRKGVSLMLATYVSKGKGTTLFQLGSCPHFSYLTERPGLLWIRGIVTGVTVQGTRAA